MFSFIYFLGSMIIAIYCIMRMMAGYIVPTVVIMVVTSSCGDAFALMTGRLLTAHHGNGCKPLHRDCNCNKPNSKKFN